ncbi:ABC transporter permease [Methanimicrococcus blatticola]|uniref:Putative ABC transport system permease protein n=1 Tax=Methanimicrococcus blatticola TaxID=91560 RepID=A0A484F4X5_9EURY|nr:ABC transporter permease [Methanimicrococcus blatticola]MBZ3935838.1 ABC transporter permease [Methanimicrococcus blatticola]MCC2508042.1 ABC transporter permease [Methanimicrococcus blatticola]TDQ68876.1 putative ABC transport system permease protein [Methanimicrococcus blatticola]
MISLSHCISMAVASLKSSKLRSGLTALGIIIGIAAVITTFTLGDSMSGFVNSQMDQGPPYIEIYSTKERIFYQQQADLVANAPGVESVTIEWGATGVVGFSNEEQNITVIGTNESMADIMEMNFTDGRFFTDKDSYVAVVGKSIAEDSFRNEIGVRSSMDISIYNYDTKEYVTESFQVIGIAGSDSELGYSYGQSSIFIPIKTMQQMSGRTDFNVMTAVVDDVNSINETEDEIERRLARNLGVSERDLDDEGKVPFTTYNKIEMLEQFQSLTSTLQYFLVGIGGISLIVGAVGIMNIMIVTVTERTKEIGTLKALGYSAKDILTMFVIESIIISVLGGIIGTLLGLLVAYVLTSLLDMPMAFPYSSILIGVGLSVFVGVLAGAQPSYRAAKMNPVDALRDL